MLLRDPARAQHEALAESWLRVPPCSSSGFWIAVESNAFRVPHGGTGQICNKLEWAGLLRQPSPRVGTLNWRQNTLGPVFSLGLERERWWVGFLVLISVQKRRVVWTFLAQVWDRVQMASKDK